MLVMTLKENDPAEHRRLVVAGLAYLVVVGLLLALSTAIYTKAFQDVTTVTLEADRAGLQMAVYGDVRYNGVLVGQIRDIQQEGDQAIITLGLEPSAASQIPKDVDASILPTTLFGRKFVSLDAPAGKGEIGIPDGMVIPEDRVTTTVELGRVLARLYPLLTTVRPVDLSATLSALATALNGRGDQIGDTLEKLDDYVTDLNVRLPTLQEDLRLLASVAQTYDLSAPDLLTVLDNLTVTSRTIIDQKQEVPAFFSSLTDLADTGSRILRADEVNAVKAVELSEPVLGVLDKYSPEYNCLLRGIAEYKPVLEKTFEGGLVKQFVEFPNPQHRAYDKRDLPAYEDRRGPRCYGLPTNYPRNWPGIDLANGTDMDTDAGRGNSYAPPGGSSSGGGGGSPLPGGLTGALGARHDGSTPSERSRTAAVLSLRSGRAGDEISELATFMYSPLVGRGGSA